MADLLDLERIAAENHLAVIGAFHTRSDDDLAPGGTLALLGPFAPGFWDHFTQSPEYFDGARDPLDRWSERVIGEIAVTLEGEAFFPFGSPPRPFIRWAMRSGRAWVSPVGLLVHDTAGLLVSYRGAILLRSELALPEDPRNPCETCVAKPCLSACPADALTRDGYDLAACHGFLDTDNGTSCMSAGCAVRRACPVSAAVGRDPAQSAFHMSAFHGKG